MGTDDLYLNGAFDTITSHQELTSLIDNPTLKEKGTVTGNSSFTKCI